MLEVHGLTFGLLVNQKNEKLRVDMVSQIGRVVLKGYEKLQHMYVIFFSILCNSSSIISSIVYGFY